MTDDHNASDQTDLVAWQWIRYSIAMFDTLVMTLLTQGVQRQLKLSDDDN